MNYIDLIVFFVCTGGIVLMGSLFYKKGTKATEFTNAGGSIPGWVVGMSIFSTYVSSISYLGNPGKAYEGDWNPFVFGLSIPIACWISARWFVPFYRRHASVSAYAFLEERFGLWARIYASACYLLTQIARMGSILFLLAMPMNILMGWDLSTVIIITSIAIIFYSMLGGMKAVIWTEAVQGVLLIGGALVCLGVLLFSMPEGPSQAFRLAIDAEGGNKFSLGSFSLSDWANSTFWVCLIYGVFTNLQNYGIDQNYVQRYHTAKSDSEARHAALFGGWLYIPVSAIFFLIGTCLYSYYQACPDPNITADGMLAMGSNGVFASKPDYVFPYFMINSLPKGLTGLLIASVFAAGMSTVATSVTSCSTIIYTDYYKRARKEATERESLWVLKLSSLGVGILGIAVALALVNVDSILDTWWKLSSIFSGGMLGLFLLGFLSRRVRNIHAVLGVVCGFAVIAWISAYEWLGLPNPGLHSYLAIVLGTTTIFLVGFFVSLLFCRKS